MKRTTIAGKPLNAASLRDSLWETLNAVKNGSLTPSEGNAIAAQARGIVSIVKLQMQVAASEAKALPRSAVTFASESTGTRPAR